MSENKAITVDKEAFELCIGKAIRESAREIYGAKLCEGLFIEDIVNTAASRSWDMLSELSDECKLFEEDEAVYKAVLVRDKDGNEIYFGKNIDERRKYCKEHDITGEDGEYIAVGTFDAKWRCFEPTGYVTLIPDDGVMRKLWKDARYAADSYSLELMYQTYGEYNMALALGMITYEESKELHDYIVVHHFNNGEWRRDCEKRYSE